MSFRHVEGFTAQKIYRWCCCDIFRLSGAEWREKQACLVSRDNVVFQDKNHSETDRLFHLCLSDCRPENFPCRIGDPAQSSILPSIAPFSVQTLSLLVAGFRVCRSTPNYDRSRSQTSAAHRAPRFVIPSPPVA